MKNDARGVGMKLPKIFLNFMPTPWLVEELELALWDEDWARFDCISQILLRRESV